MYDLELRRLQTKEDINQPYHGVWEQIPKRTARTGLAVAFRALLLEERSFSRPSPRLRAEKLFHSSVLRSPTCSRSVAWCSTSRHPAATNSRKWHGLSRESCEWRSSVTMKPATNTPRQRARLGGRPGEFQKRLRFRSCRSSAQAASPRHTFSTDFTLKSLAGIHNPLASI